MAAPETGIATTILRHRARPGPALGIDGDDLTWAELAAEIGAWAQRFAAHPAPGRIGFVLGNGRTLIPAALGAIRAGGNALILDPDWPAEIRDRVLERLGPTAVIDAEAPPAAGAMDASLPDEDSGALFYTGFTSGSTGLPRGFERDQRSWLESFAAEAAAFGIGADDVIVVPGNLVHSMFFYAAVRGLHAGCRTLTFRRFHPGRILKRTAAVGGTVIYGTPPQFDALAAAPGAATYPTVRRLLTAGAKLPDTLRARLRARFPNARLIEFYGASELSFVTYGIDGETPAGSVGRPFPGVRVTIRDGDGADVAAGETGRVFVESPLAFRGYALADDRPAATAGPALSVGDVGYLDGDGFLYLVGRADRMISVAARNVYPEEVEAVLEAHPDVDRAAVFGIADRRRGRRLAAVIKPAGGTAIAAPALARWCRDRLAAHKVPARFVALAEWPETAAQKSDYRRLAAVAAAPAAETEP